MVFLVWRLVWGLGFMAGMVCCDIASLVVVCLAFLWVACFRFWVFSVV